MRARTLPRRLNALSEKPQVAVGAVVRHARTRAKCGPERLQLAAVAYAGAGVLFQRFVEVIFRQKSFAAALQRAAIFNPCAPAAAAQTGLE